jgi:hypothetical protein
MAQNKILPSPRTGATESQQIALLEGNSVSPQERDQLAADIALARRFRFCGDRVGQFASVNSSTFVVSFGGENVNASLPAAASIVQCL